MSVRDVTKAQHLADRGVRVRRGSYADPAALLDSFEGAEQVLLVSSNDPGADQVSLHRVGIETAVAAGARRILYTSHQSVGLDSPFHPARDHAATEAILAGGIAWTSSHGTPEPMARLLLGTFRAARQGRFAGVDPLLGDLLGRRPRTVRDLLAERAAA